MTSWMTQHYPHYLYKGRFLCGVLYFGGDCKQCPSLAGTYTTVKVVGTNLSSAPHSYPTGHTVRIWQHMTRIGLF